MFKTKVNEDLIEEKLQAIKYLSINLLCRNDYDEDELSNVAREITVLSGDIQFELYRAWKEQI